MHTQTQPAPDKSSIAWAIAGSAALITLGLQWTLLALGATGGNLDYDQNTFHIPAIRAFAAQWPDFQLADYSVATAPGYHLILATFVKVFGEDLLSGSVPLLRLWSGLLCAVLIGAVTRHAVRTAGVSLGVMLGLILLANQYLLFVGTRVAPESLSWLLVGLAMMIPFQARRWHSAAALIAVLSLLVVATRQSHIWLTSLAWITAWLGSQQRNNEKPSQILPLPEDFQLRDRIVRALPALGMTLPSFGLIAYFYMIWDGLVPPQFQDDADQAIEGTSKHIGGNPAVPATVLSLLAVYAGIFLPVLWREFRELFRGDRPGRWLLIAGGMAGFIVAVSVETSYSHAAGRWGSYWSLVKVLPAPFERSVVIVPLSTIGGALVGALAAVTPARSRWILLTTLAAFVSANTFNSKAWIRYFDPFVAIWIILSVCEIVRLRAERLTLRSGWPSLTLPALATLVFLALSVKRLLG